MVRVCLQMTALDISDTQNQHHNPYRSFVQKTHEVTFRFFQDKIYNAVRTDLINIGFSQAPMFNTDC